IYGISQNPVTKDYVMVLYGKYFTKYCVKCDKMYTNASYKWCRPCQINYFKNNFTNWISGNERIDNVIQEMQLKIRDSSDIVFEWIPYNQFSNIEKIGRGGFATVYSAMWEYGPLGYYKDKSEWIRDSDKKIALKCLDNSQNITNEFLNLLIKLKVLNNIIDCLKEIHQKQMVHHDFHIGNILFKEIHLFTSNYISDMGLCREIGNIDETNIYGVMPYVAPEVLRGNPY